MVSMCTVWCSGVMYVRAVYFVVGQCTVLYFGVLCVRAVTVW